MKNPLIILAVTSLVTVTGCSRPASQEAITDVQHETGQETRRVDGDLYSLDDINEPVIAPLVKSEKKRDPAGQVAVRTRELQQSEQALAVQPATTSAYQGASKQSFNQQLIRAAIEPTDRENYLEITESEVTLARAEPVSTFSVDVDTAAYSNIRRMLLQEGRLPPSDAVRIEELVNYFDYDYPQPDSLDTPFSVFTEIAPAPWNAGKHLLHIGLQGYQPEPEDRPDANLVFLVDVSGSMLDANKLGLVKRSLKLLVNQLGNNDRIALVVYAGAAGVVLDSTRGSRKREIMRAIDNLSAGGSTNGGAGIRLAYDIATEHFVKGGINRVLIASDGDMNVGTVNLEALKDLVEQKRESGVTLTTLGFGTGNYNYSLMEQLADTGNGNAAYIDSIREAHKVLVDEMQSTLLTIAKDVKIQIEFNPALVQEYRLIGYENRMLNKEDFRNDKVDAGDIGAGHTVTALYEVVLTGSDQGLVPTLRYGHSSGKPDASFETENRHNELAYLRLRYKQPDGYKSREIAQAVTLDKVQPHLENASQNLRFSASVAGFGQLLRGGKFTEQWGFDDAIRLARAARGDDPHGYRSEFVSMAKLAKGYAPATTHNKG